MISYKYLYYSMVCSIFSYVFPLSLGLLTWVCSWIYEKVDGHAKWTTKALGKQLIPWSSWCTEKCCLLINSHPHPHPLSMGRLEFVCKRSESPWRILNLMYVFHEHLLFSIFMKSPPSLLNYGCICGSIFPSSPKAQWSHTQNRSLLFWVTTPLRHTPICVEGKIILLHFTSLPKPYPDCSVFYILPFFYDNTIPYSS